MLNKKASSPDFFVIIMVVMLSAITLLVCYILVDKVDTQGVFKDTPAAQSVVNNSKTALLNMDTMMLFIISGLSLFVLISSAIVYNYLALFIISILLLFLAILFSASMSNGFWFFRTSSNTIINAAAAYPKLTFLMDHLPLYVLFMGMAVAIVMYTSWRRQ